MKKHIEYYKDKVDFYRRCGEKISILKAYFYLYERYYYNAISESIEYREFNSIYSFIFEHIKDTLDDLDVSSIEEIYAFTFFLLELGYLSYDEKMPYEANNIGANELPILSAITLNRHGKCRHNSALLRDILNYRDYKSYVLAGVKEDIEELLNHKYIDKTDANHAITAAEDKNYSYLLDVSAREIFVPTDDGEIYSDKLSRFTLCQNKLVPLGDEIFYDLNLDKPYKKIDEIRKEVSKSIDCLWLNLEAFEEFNKKVTPALKDAEKVYQRIITKRAN